MTVTAIEKVLEIQAAREAAALEAYRELVRSLAKGDKAAKPEVIDAVLTAAHKSVSDLQTDVATTETRNAHRKAIADATESLKRKPALDAEVERLKQERQAAEDKYNAELFPIRQQLESIQTQQQAAQSAELALRESMPGHIRERLDQLNVEMNQAAEAKKRADKTLADVQSRDPSEWTGAGGSRVTPTHEELESHKASVKRAEGQVTEAKAACDAIVAEQERLHREANEL